MPSYLMSREIKFRAWDGEKFRESFVIHQANGLAMVETTTPLGSRYLETQAEWAVQQYTGLKDKNGVEIYEGDIINNHEEYNNKKVVNYDPCRCYFCLIDTDEYPDILYNGEMFNVAGEGSNFSARLEVIGNIFEGHEGTARIADPRYREDRSY